MLSPNLSLDSPSLGVRLLSGLTVSPSLPGSPPPFPHTVFSLIKFYTFNPILDLLLGGPELISSYFSEMEHESHLIKV